jgi:hypothetical protein
MEQSDGWYGMFIFHKKLERNMISEESIAHHRGSFKRQRIKAEAVAH